MLHVDSPIPGCKCALAEMDRHDFAPGESGTFRFLLRPAQRPGTEYAQSIVVPSNDPRQPRATIVIRGKMQDALSSRPQVIRAANLKVGEGWRRQCTIYCTDPAARFRVMSATCDLPETNVQVDSELDGEGRPKIIVEQATTSRVGSAVGKVTLTTDHPRYRELIIPVEIEIASRRTISPSMLLFRSASANEPQLVRISSETPFQLAVDADAYHDWSIQLKSDDDTHCRWTMQVRHESVNPATVIRETLKISVAEIPGEDQLTIPVTVTPPTGSAVADTRQTP